jgi:hypothetical protein
VPYLRLVVPALVTIFGLVATVELLSFLTIGEATGKKLVLFGNAIDVHAATPWIVAFVCLIGGGLWLRWEGRRFHRVWEATTADLKADPV